MDAKSLSYTLTNFSAKFLNGLDKEMSMVSSPLSAEFVLALLTLGAREPAHTELLNSLGFCDNDAIRKSFSSMSSKLRSIKGVTLNIANKVYVMDGDYDFKPRFKKDAVKVFDAEFEKVDFGNGTAAASLINNWVEKKTNNKITDLLSSDSLNVLTRIVLVNAIYFKGNWVIPFDPDNTMDRPFYINSDTTVDVPMMNNKDIYKYGESDELDAQLLEIPYAGKKASMIVVLPNEIEGLDGVVQKLADGYDLLKDIEECCKERVEVSIPKFIIQTEIDLANLLPGLGIRDIFREDCTSLSELLNKPEQLYVSKAVQKAYIEINEEGATAAAATGMTLVLRSGGPSATPFLADRGFHYLLASVERIIFFLGVYRAPD